jgi:hypothetical protein
MALDNLRANHQDRNVSIQPDWIVPKDELVHIFKFRKRISKKKIEEIAIHKYRKCGKGIDFKDVVREFGCPKKKAQRVLKDCCQRRMKNVLAPILFRATKRTLPQRYFPTSIKAEILQDLMKKQNVPIDPTGATYSSTPHSSASSNSLDNMTLQTLEGHILPMLPNAPLFIHNLHLKLKIAPERYAELELPTAPGNKGKRHYEVIGTSGADCTFYPNGTVNVEIRCSNHPFKLQTEDDRSRMLVFFGQVRDRIITLLADIHERIVPDIIEWYVTECDVNKDIKVSDWFQFSGLKIQIKYFDHLFRIYIKSMGENTVSRVEESRHPHKPAIEVINDVFNPVERIEHKITEIHSMVSRITDSLRVPSRINATAITEQNNNTSSQLEEGG